MASHNSFSFIGGYKSLISNIKNLSKCLLGFAILKNNSGPEAEKLQKSFKNYLKKKIWACFELRHYAQ